MQKDAADFSNERAATGGSGGDGTLRLQVREIILKLEKLFLVAFARE